MNAIKTKVRATNRQVPSDPVWPLGKPVGCVDLNTKISDVQSKTQNKL